MKVTIFIVVETLLKRFFNLFLSFQLKCYFMFFDSEIYITISFLILHIKHKKYKNQSAFCLLIKVNK